ncbi:DUF5701 family protein [Prauserella muralis]|uniref:Uncharacterized protein n=1 Tax=Prauserella muralis TaxID=588067 RepID=A0A2V4B235_9PSEU|nr:DUF5701 family protein [Prauserella muralis]PXY28113.1 hypothetical protein BAY60_17395 [Prauserella muralis]TWE22086.1 hypothetical protein FHX69_3319 [Prauserella muralis]
MPPIADDPGAEFDRQVQNLVERDYPTMAGLTSEQFTDLVAPLRELAAGAGNDGDDPGTGLLPFLIVVTRQVVPIEQMMQHTTLHNKTKPGFVDRSFEPGALERFVATEQTDLPDDRVYLLFEIERGEEFCGAIPNDAMDTIAARGRSLLTIEEGIAMITHYPESLVKNKCFSLGGSRSGDRRVPAIWISQHAPKLGWCWERNPHTWLGMASAGHRKAGATGRVVPGAGAAKP